MAGIRETLEVGGARLRGAGSESPRLDAELLLGHVVGLERTSILAHPEAPLSDGQLERFRALVERRAAGEPGSVPGRRPRLGRLLQEALQLDPAQDDLRNDRK